VGDGGREIPRDNAVANSVWERNGVVRAT